MARLLGAVMAALLVWAAYGHGAYVDAHLGAPSPASGANALQVLLVEALIAFILVFTVISITTDPRVPSGTATVAIGFSLAAGVLLGRPISGGAGNPARALRPMIVAGTFPVWVFYTIGPLLGPSRRQAPSASWARQARRVGETDEEDKNEARLQAWASDSAKGSPLEGIWTSGLASLPFSLPRRPAPELVSVAWWSPAARGRTATAKQRLVILSQHRTIHDVSPTVSHRH